MHNAERMPKRALYLATAPLLAAALAGCSYFVYIPMLILVPFMPLIQLAVKVAARYGPLLLMLAEADPCGLNFTPGMIAAGPADALRAAALPQLEQQLMTEVLSNQNLRAVCLVEAATLSPAWLDEQQRAAHARGLALRIVFVDSRHASLSHAARAACAARNIPLYGTPGLAASLAADALAHQSSPYFCSAAHASLMAGAAAMF